MSKTFQRASLVLALACLSACGGGGGAAGTPTANTGSTSAAGSASSATTLSGVAATGKALASARISLRDAAGVIRRTTSDSNGAFSLDMSGLQAPMVLEAQSGGTTLYAPVFAGDTHVNVNQLTNAQLRQWLRSRCADDTCRGQAATQLLYDFLAAGKGDLAALTADSFDSDLLALTSAAGGSAGKLRTDKTFAANGKGWDALLDANPYGAITVGDSGITSQAGLLQAAVSSVPLAGAPVLPTYPYDNLCRGTLNATVYRTANVDMYGQGITADQQRRAALLADYYLRMERSRFEVQTDTGLTGQRAQYCVDGSAVNAGGSASGGAIGGSLGYFSGPQAAGEDDWRQVLHHETVHMAVNAATGNTAAGGPNMVEKWLDEGLAVHFAGQDGWLNDVDGWFADSDHSVHPMDVGLDGMIGSQRFGNLGYYEMFRLMLKQLEAANAGPQELGRRVASVLRAVKGKPIATNPGVFQSAASQYLFGNSPYATYRSNLPATLRDYVASHTVAVGVSGGTVLRGSLLAEGAAVSCSSLRNAQDVQLVAGKLLLPKVDGSYRLLAIQSVSKAGGQATVSYYPLQTVTISNGAANPATLALAGQTVASLSCSN